MLEIDVADREYFDEENNVFVPVKGGKLILEHSLLSISKWESQWGVPFLSEENLSDERLIDYVRCMITNRPTDESLYKRLSSDDLQRIIDYIKLPMTATTFRRIPGETPSREVVTSELIYCWMVTMNIPFECQKWHLNRLLTLTRVIGIKNTPPKKMSRAEILEEQQRLNAERLKKYNTTG